MCKHIPDVFPIQNGVKQGDASTPFSLALGYDIDRIEGSQEVLELNEPHQLLVYANGVNILAGEICTIRRQSRCTRFW
jgi:hypothetical protein